MLPFAPYRKPGTVSPEQGKYLAEMKASRELLWPEGVTWEVTSPGGRVLTYVFAHDRLREIWTVIRPFSEGSCSLECRYDGSGDPRVVAERKARLISLGEFITAILDERHRATQTAAGPGGRRTHRCALERRHGAATPTQGVRQQGRGVASWPLPPRGPANPDDIPRC